MHTPNSNAHTKATTIKKTFSQETSVSITIDASSSIIWALLTNANDFPRWNSTVTSLEGKIELGQTIKLRSILDEKRVFKIKVQLMEVDKKMIWGDSQGNRIFILEKSIEGVSFSMKEKIGGLLFPLYARYLPPFENSFDQFAMDLKNEAENIANSKEQKS